ncbi:hypothetical protein GCM10010317_077920 [Streptomyces mirabilis]|uniref:hypothetical protein n=1 Tax=Streptomyces mirabilis TaxID=68239 RepID=UPI00167E249F|nr:hypothetical protein [Streptomyces mirabilis]GHD70507.1 hypothetical protein GCM10010317_077920 [Streptomyces mirabilis]
MTAINPALAARIAELGVPLSADHAPLTPAREQQIRVMEPAPPGLLGLGRAGSESEQRLYGRAVELHAANRELLAEIGRLRGELAERSTGAKTEWGVRLVFGGWTSPRRSRQNALEDIEGMRAYNEAAVLVTRTVHRSEWTEAK